MILLVARPPLLRAIFDEEGKAITQTKWVGWENYRVVLNLAGVRAALASPEGKQSLLAIDFWGGFAFTLTFTLVTLPLVLLVGLILALSVNSLNERLRGGVIFVTLLPFIITPVIGALAIRWLFVGDGIVTAGLEHLLKQDIAFFAQGWTIELLMLFYRVWHVAPFAFVIFYAALQTVEGEKLEAAKVDGASRWQTLRYVILPHLMPLMVFVSLIHLMDSYRVFDEIVGFNAQAFRQSLQWLTFDFLTPDDAGNRSIGRASATAMLTMIGIFFLLIPLLRNTWQERQR
ncbi:MAG: sugar ABC transporter permease [Deinococcales bacterium]